jgi:hypothetical protein
MRVWGSGVRTQLNGLPVVLLLSWSKQGGHHAQHCALVLVCSRSAGKCAGGQSRTSYPAAQTSHCLLVVVKKGSADGTWQGERWCVVGMLKRHPRILVRWGGGEGWGRVACLMRGHGSRVVVVG